MPQRTIRFTIRPNGRVEERVEGMTGDACHQLTERLEAGLGSVQHREPTAEAFLQPDTQSQTLSNQLS